MEREGDLYKRPKMLRDHGPKFAVIFRTHFWDEFTARQFARLRSCVGRGEVFILVDETRGKIDGISDHRVFGLTDQRIIDRGFVDTGEGSVQWFSGDVPLYLFQEEHPNFDYYVQLEYDVCLNIDLEQLIRSVAEDRVDMVALSNETDHKSWHWTPSCTDVYERSEIIHQLICFSIFSKRALVELMSSRLRQASMYRLGQIKRWPYCEGFLATEARKLKLNVAELSKYGDVSHYEWWPPFMESELRSIGAKEFIHPVLDSKRGVQSLFKYETHIRLSDYLNPFGWVHRKLRSLGAAGYLNALASPAFRDGLKRTVRQRFEAT